ncbi:Proactivator polypeptide [Histomonas meleagridis]|uniref:Proactivator polypeptide n=1 Tax=Histomonas meleagridis TaxID=135588 RepID=UPI00355A8687|nr:Proactivator polypeptide [Histomonas meleagridis]KAH0802518.1 Proactivator polypeptide [Histomonas meleagridis]
MSFVGQHLSDKQICAKLRFCQSNDEDEVFYVEIPEGIDNASACSICKDIIAGVVSILKNTKVTSQVASLAANLCKKLPTAAQSICKSIVSTYLPNVIGWIGSGISTLNICKKLSICK